MKKRLILAGIILGLVLLFLKTQVVFSPKSSLQAEKKYLNEKFGFSFNYPFSWQKEEWDLESAAKLKNLTDGTILYQGKFFNPSAESGRLEVLIWENQGRVSPLTYLNWYRHEDLDLSLLPSKENFFLDGLMAVSFLQIKTSRSVPLFYIFLKKDNYLFEISQERKDLVNLSLEQATQSANLQSSIYDPILQSFRFLVK